MHFAAAVVVLIVWTICECIGKWVGGLLILYECLRKDSCSPPKIYAKELNESVLKAHKSSKVILSTQLFSNPYNLRSAIILEIFLPVLPLFPLSLSAYPQIMA